MNHQPDTSRRQEQDMFGVPHWRAVVGTYLLPIASLTLMLLGSFGSPGLWLVSAGLAVTSMVFSIANSSRTKEAKDKSFFIRMTIACAVIALLSAALYAAYGN